MGVPPSEKMEKVPAPKEKKGTASAAAARVVVELPADASLYVDDQLMKTKSERRTFDTPKLDSDQTYYYILRAEVQRDGEKVTQTKRIIVRAGDSVRASFADLEAIATARRELSARR
jgi:uncharacterized protein (TIGR03000 family)